MSPRTKRCLRTILTEPKNALVRQYRALFALDNVDLVSTSEALRVVARRALAQGTGARGLHTIMEHALTDLMYEIPSRDDVRSVRVMDKVISGDEPPLLELTQRRRQPHAVIALCTVRA